MTTQIKTTKTELNLLQSRLSQVKINAARSTGLERLKWLLLQAAIEATIRQNYGTMASREA